MDKKECYKVVRQVYSYLKTHPEVKFKKMKGKVGYYNEDEEEMGIDYRRDIIPTLIHEVLHHYHPDWNETQVRHKESETINCISIRQAKNILKALTASF